MNRKGLMAVADAAFFIVLIGIAAVLILQASPSDDGPSVQEVSDSCDAIFESRISSMSFGYPEDRSMRVTDLVAASVVLGDGNAELYLKSLLSRTYPWENSYSFSLMYGGRELDFGVQGNNSVTRTYQVEFGGDLTVMLCLNF